VSLPGRAGDTSAIASLPPGPVSSSLLEAFLFSTAAVAVAEIGDKTQLLSLLLAARYRRFWPIAAGVLVATLLNHALAAWLGRWIAQAVSPNALAWAVALSFFAVAAWTLKPDRIDDEAFEAPHRGAFVATTIAFFLAEIGDKTQVATVVLAANYAPLWAVIAGTTLGMMLANVPAIALGARFASRLPLRAARWTAAALFVLLAVLVLAR
jgi:Ca2+/H+ antiporter, TMEM165/GDT1 family